MELKVNIYKKKIGYTKISMIKLFTATISWFLVQAYESKYDTEVKILFSHQNIIINYIKYYAKSWTCAWEPT